MMRWLLIIVLLCSPAWAQISFIGKCNGTTSCTPPAHQVGDFFIAFAGRDASTVAPTLPTGWTSVTTPNINGTSTADSVLLVACKVATTTAETATGFTNAGALDVRIYRGQQPGLTAVCASEILGTPQNFTSTINTTSTTETFNAVTNDTASSWDLAGGYAPAATAGIATAPTGMTNRSSQGTILGGHDTNAGVSSFSSANVTLTTAGRIITSTIELRAAFTPTVTTLIDNFNGYSDGNLGGAGDVSSGAWVRIDPAASPLVVSSQQVATFGTPAGGQSQSGPNATYGPDYDVIIDVPTAPIVGYVLLHGSFDITNKNGYEFAFLGTGFGGPLYNIARLDANVGTTLVSKACSRTLANGEKLWGQKRGSVLTFYRGNSSGVYAFCATATDSTYSTGNMGAGLHGNGTETTTRIDNFSGGTVSAAPTGGGFNKRNKLKKHGIYP